MNDLSPRVNPRFMTVADVSELLCISADEVFELLRTAELRGILIGRPSKWRIEVSELESYIEAKYEESRRAGLWRSANLASIVDFDRAPATTPARAEQH